MNMLHVDINFNSHFDIIFFECRQKKYATILTFDQFLLQNLHGRKTRAEVLTEILMYATCGTTITILKFSF